MPLGIQAVLTSQAPNWVRRLRPNPVRSSPLAVRLPYHGQFLFPDRPTHTSWSACIRLLCSPAGKLGSAHSSQPKACSVRLTTKCCSGYFPSLYMSIVKPILFARWESIQRNYSQASNLSHWPLFTGIHVLRQRKHNSTSPGNHAVWPLDII